MDLVRTVVIGDVELRHRTLSMSEFDIDALRGLDEPASLDLEAAERETGGYGTTAPTGHGAAGHVRTDVALTGDHHAR